ncbi:LOW QUALITY PROTEIN: inositol 1,4,5-triphosphate receptor associated 1 [Alosa sapidissima]|uniref:LOW QUALITY PROTEIN: inositol 1,4,5-triphosphate receptor associated 1 n=1 Tax=Alosa sapidissima TaxID=34773 RepID=UPI001C09190E|nr:LOW QUALITY PROTEIN: inositol 1,4,5-triphosphate receptor associated 1 [Alosa sapidissima]
MPTLPEEEEDSPDSSSSSPTSYTPTQGKAVKVAVATPSIVLPQMAASVQPNPRPVEQARAHSPRPRLARNLASLGVPITTVDSEGHVLDLLKDDLPEPALSAEERSRNLLLLEEAKRVSERFLTRRGRRSTCSLSDSPTALTPSPTPGSSPVPSRSSSTSVPPPPADRLEPNLPTPLPTQRQEVPSVREQNEADKVDTEALRRVEWRPSEKRKVSSGTLSPRHAQTGGLKKAASTPAPTPDDSPAPTPATGVAKPVPRPPMQQAPCTAEIKTIGAFPPLMRAVSWDTVGTLSLRNDSYSPAPKGEEPAAAPSFSKMSGYKDFPVPPVNLQKLSKLREEHKLIRNNSISSTKLPELCETAEQERGPSPCPVPDSAQEEESKEKTDVLPSISDVMLRKLKLHRGLPGCAPPLSEKEVENAFVQLSLAYRNDSYTLETRLKQAERERNLTEENTEKELEEFKGSLKGTACLWQSLEQRESYQRLLETMAVLQRLAIRLSSRAEMVGAVRQEKRMNKATEVMMQYVENLKRTYEKDHAELMEFKKLANQNSNRCYGGSIDTGDDGIPRPSRSMSLTMGKAMPRRRVSVAVVPKFNLLNIPGQTPGQSPGQLPVQAPGQSPGQLPVQAPVQLLTQTPGTSCGPTLVQGPSPALPVLCEATVKTAPPSDATLHTAPESGKQSECDSAAPAKSLSVEQIRSELKAKIEEEAYKKGYEEGLKRLKELKEEEEKKTDDTTKEKKEEKEEEEKEEEKEKSEEVPGERDEEAHREKRSNSRLWDLLSVVERSCPKVLWRNRVMWVALTSLLVLLFLFNLLGFLSNSSVALGDASSETADAPPTQNKLFGLNVGSKAKQAAQE